MLGQPLYLCRIVLNHEGVVFAEPLLLWTRRERRSQQLGPVKRVEFANKTQIGALREPAFLVEQCEHALSLVIQQVDAALHVGVAACPMSAGWMHVPINHHEPIGPMRKGREGRGAIMYVQFVE
jgi:hypothetical protein